ncbi:MAG: primosomal protein N' [Heliobacteriaceae bacterium]|nr:primosomal protein N' [Heliobacteriaceae bacterium]
MYVQVIVDVPQVDCDQNYYYRVPADLAGQVAPGNGVWVSFNGRVVRGWAVALGEELPADLKNFSVQPVIGVDETYRLNADLLALVVPLAEAVMSTRADILRLLAPPGMRRGRPVARICLPEKLSPEQIVLWEGIDPDCALILNRLSRAPKQSLRRSAFSGWPKSRLAGVLARLAGAGLVEEKICLPSRREKRAVRSPGAGPALLPAGRAPVLTTAQQKAVDALATAIDQQRPGTFLLHGVTGSGKTEVYLQAASRALARGRQVLYLVPEIALTPQAGNHLAERFGRQAVVVLHSKLSEAVRRREWYRIAAGQVPVVIGARSAVFTPLPDLGLIIVDEEHETSYRQEREPKYHARQVALARAARCRAVAVLGSATPSLESYQKALTGKYQLLRLPERVAGRKLPAVNLVDMREELTAGNRGMFSRALLQAITQCLQREQQVMLYLNRRGFAPFIICRECGNVLTCPRCSISLVYHRVGERLHCHYCHFRQMVPKQCPVCHSRAVRFFGTGTQRIESELAGHFPGAQVLRLDRDAAEGPGVEKVISTFSETGGDILVGTQMITKGLDFPRVTLVGILAADASLHIADFQATERTFQLLAQVAGRAGRAGLPGEVIVQSYCPEHYCLQLVKDHDFEAFYAREIALRERLGYPPFSRLVRLEFRGADQTAVAVAAETWTETFKQLNGSKEFNVWGPAPAAVVKVDDKFRWQLTLRLAGGDARPLRQAIRRAGQAYTSRRGCPAGVKVSITVDPAGL